MAVTERLSASLRRAPYVWLIATILAFGVMNHPVAQVAKPPGRGNTPLAWFATVGSLLATAGWLSLRAERVRRDIPKPKLVVVRWVFAMLPFFCGWCVVALGAEQWAFSVGFITTVALLLLSARKTRREELDWSSP